MVRILGFTRRSGEYRNITELVDLCRETFGNVVACVGVLDPGQQASIDTTVVIGFTVFV